MLRRETTFFDKAWVLTWTSCFLKFIKKVTSSQTIKRYTQNQNLKWIQRTMKKKVHLSLTTGQFCFQNTWQSKDCIFQITCVGYLIKKKTWFSKGLFKKRTSLISFQQTRLWIDMIFEIWELIPKQGRLLNTEKHRLSMWNPW